MRSPPQPQRAVWASMFRPRAVFDAASRSAPSVAEVFPGLSQVFPDPAQVFSAETFPARPARRRDHAAIRTRELNFARVHANAVTAFMHLAVMLRT